ncbi:uncharacterized protein PHACADRAFT_249456 [Phanerochaete carnosa HHB-10118-sp]|uniref:HAMP domain-containing protein n=1 Tax=Phanerochaete carnosa (strain HHB-10118-sp) TaxID=650164 RepID=K5V8N4_PHACS|nr:uncharacterized protein PHACADRAFT_249456 [Phanerochaete carnosa HHB-10118-sp]EKM59186.1 hypothetical protein PHACADRAFT_249456 [Phanerochaete carnosa HHB-10118-sp]
MEPREELRLLKAVVSDVCRVCNAVAQGDLSRRITLPVVEVVMVQLMNVVNDMAEKLDSVVHEVVHVIKEVNHGKLGIQARVKDAQGSWKELTDSVNVMTASLTVQVRAIAAATSATARGQPGPRQRITGVAAAGEMQDLLDSVDNAIVGLPQ